MKQSPIAENVSRNTSAVSRVCKVCGASRPLVLFPKAKDGHVSRRCQLCKDTGRRKLSSDLNATIIARSKRAAVVSKRRVRA